MPRPLLSLVFLSTLGGCTAIKATVHSVEADAALRAARERGAFEQAPYETTMASLYLDKAREEIESSQFGLAEDLAKRSIDWSDKAIIFMERGGKVQEAGADLTDRPTAPAPVPEAGPVPATVPAPAPAPEPVNDDFKLPEEEIQWDK